MSQHPKPAGRVSGLGLPTPPRKWGPWIEKSRDWSTVAAVNPSATLNRPAKPNSTSFRNSGSVTAVLRCKELRPWTTHTFTPTDDHRDIVLLASDLDIAAVDITSTATARGINGNFVTETTHPVAPPVDLTELIRLRLDQIRVAYARADG